MREASQAPRNSRELAVRNQFFTPRYVVEFLTDNTLGRIWYEMRQGRTTLKEQCRFLVRRPDEVFLAESTARLREGEPPGEPSSEAARPEPRPPTITEARSGCIQIREGEPPGEPSSQSARPEPRPPTTTEARSGCIQIREGEPPGERSSEAARTEPRPPRITISRLGCVQIAQQLTTAAEADFPPFSAEEDQIQRMIELAHCVSAYEQLGDRLFDWFTSAKGAIESSQFDGKTTGELLNYLFCTCRQDRMGGFGDVYREPWFVAAANEVRRRFLAGHGESLSQEQLLKAPVAIPYRPKKDPRDIKVLDPACGSGHFLLYCFDLLLAIYREAWEDEFSPKSEMTGKSLREDYPSLDALRPAIPGLILRHNRHGIDIDPRCARSRRWLFGCEPSARSMTSASVTRVAPRFERRTSWWRSRCPASATCSTASCARCAKTGSNR